jgi:hypothetical protein
MKMSFKTIANGLRRNVRRFNNCYQLVLRIYWGKYTAIL